MRPNSSYCLVPLLSAPPPDTDTHIHTHTSNLLKEEAKTSYKSSTSYQCTVALFQLWTVNTQRVLIHSSEHKPSEFCSFLCFFIVFLLHVFGWSIHPSHYLILILQEFFKKISLKLGSNITCIQDKLISLWWWERPVSDFFKNSQNKKKCIF